MHDEFVNIADTVISKGKRGLDFFEMLMLKNVSLYSEAEIQFVLSFKERQYAVRRERIRNYCSVQDESFGRRIDTLIYNPVDRVSYCPIAKVASSTWCNHFVKLGRTTTTHLATGSTKFIHLKIDTLGYP